MRALAWDEVALLCRLRRAACLRRSHVVEATRRLANHSQCTCWQDVWFKG